jgi:hypothetical protein
MKQLIGLVNSSYYQAQKIISLIYPQLLCITTTDSKQK